MKLNFNRGIKSAQGLNIGNLTLALAEAFKRLDVRDEHLIRKSEEWIETLIKMEPLVMEEADFRLFKTAMISSDAIQVYKMQALKIMDKAEKLYNLKNNNGRAQSTRRSRTSK